MAFWLSNCYIPVFCAMIQSCASGYFLSASMEAGEDVAFVIVCGGGVVLRVVNTEAMLVPGSAERCIGLNTDLILWWFLGE